MAERKQESLQAERIVQEECIKFRSWLNGLEVVPTIIALRQKMQDILQMERKKAGPILENLTSEQLKAVEMMTGSIINKVLHDPIRFLKEPRHDDHTDDKDEKIDRVQKIFNLNKGMGEK